MDHYDGHIDAMKARERLRDRGIDVKATIAVQDKRNTQRLAEFKRKITN